QIDKTNGQAPSDSVGSCDVPIPPPVGATSPCQAGTKACVGGVVKCQGSVLATSVTDGCGVDSNCDGQLTGQPDTTSDVHNCGGCGIDCYAGSSHSNWTCNNNVCQFTGCQAGFYDNGGGSDTAGDQSCDYQCSYVSATEACNGADDNCNGQIDENITPLSPAQVCGVSPAATSAECTSQVTVACQNGGWKCTFPANVCSTIVNGKPSCSATPEICDTLDNNCNGVKNETSPNFGQACASDDSAPGTHGACRTTGTYVCDPNTSTTATKCSAVKADCATLPGGCTELCDGIDNDCDGLVDESNINKGTNSANFVKPVATKIGASLWMSSYEASRPSATTTSAGSGNGYFCTAYASNSSDPYCKATAGSLPSAPANTPLQKTPACSVPNKIPWFNVTPVEVEQTCKAAGGRACTTAEYTTGCQATSSCTYGYAPRGSACTTSYTGSKFCNIGPSWDFNMITSGDQDGILPTASSSLMSCYADWSGLQNNTAATNKIYDITGNLREITRVTTGTTYNLMGGANNSAEAGSTCSFNFYTVSQTFQFYDTGFRCCFDADPTL
ncbi:MAG: MopE-related protein, partial [Polyangiaceae bacterium]